ncbi:universal stress protein [Actinoplanes sp. TRM88002]|uniref:Universal stress protein n=1 Tax=Paractinoplanes hotanensis TaxID=2906497 RepID=A0ABT0YC50_9ACTN|nr:universal stress protein [Actinoplanes hotanensis]
MGISLSLAGLEALRFAVAEARRRDSRLMAVRAWVCHRSSWAWPDREYERTLADKARRTIVEAFEEAAGEVPADLPVVRRTAEGWPPIVLKESVTSPRDLLVIGAGRRWPAGEVVRACVRHQACPVVVVPPPEMARLARGRTTARRLFREAAAALEKNQGNVPD